MPPPDDNEAQPNLHQGGAPPPLQQTLVIQLTLYSSFTFVLQVVRAVLEDFDVTYAPIVTSYGSVAATLGHSPGTTVELFVTFLATDELEHMHK